LSCVRNAFEAFPLIPYLVVNKIKGDQNTQKVTWTLKEAKQLTANDHECVPKLIFVKHLLYHEQLPQISIKRIAST